MATIKVSDFIVDFCIKNNIHDIFGYPGGMVTYLMDSIRKRKGEIKSHLLYHEQALAFAGCAFSSLKRKPTIVYATSGPGAINLITGIANAYFDSIPVIFITGQVNRNESSLNTSLRQRGFQETDIVSMVKNITKKAIYIDDEKIFVEILNEAYDLTLDGRMGPVLIDIPMDIFKCELKNYDIQRKQNHDNTKINFPNINKYKRPLILLGAGVKNSLDIDYIRGIIDKVNAPIVTTLLAYDILPKNHKLNYGFIGVYGKREANFLIAKADLVISIGARLDIRQVGSIRENFANGADIIRIDIDKNETDYAINGKETIINCLASSAFEWLSKLDLTRLDWIDVCDKIKSLLVSVDRKSTPELIVSYLNEVIPTDSIITTDVGQNQIWIAQYFNNIDNFTLFSGGLGSMGYSLPASIGAAYANPDKIIICFSGDGGFQMNIQELQTIYNDNLPIKIFIFNNKSLGMIRHFQEMYFDSNYFDTTIKSGFSVPNFANIAKAYGIHSIQITNFVELKNLDLTSKKPALIEIIIDEDTYITPKLKFGEPSQDQEPQIDRALYNYLMKI